MKNEALAVEGSLAGVDRHRVLEVVESLSRDHVLDTEGERPPGPSRASEGPLIATLSKDDGAFVLGLKRALARLAEPARETLPFSAAMSCALDGAELIVSGEILMGRASRLPKVLPGLIYLVIVPTWGRSEAMRMSKRAGELLGGTEALGM